MKHLLFFLFSLMTAEVIHAQNGHGIEFGYTDGYRVLRQYNSLATLKPGKTPTGTPADTIIGYYPDDQQNEVLEDKIFVRAYPNPVQDILFVENRSWEEGSSATLKLYDVTGKLLWEKTTTQPKETISMSALPPGNYHVKYYTNYTYLISWKIAKI